MDPPEEAVKYCLFVAGRTTLPESTVTSYRSIFSAWYSTVLGPLEELQRIWRKLPAELRQEVCLAVDPIVERVKALKEAGRLPWLPPRAKPKYASELPPIDRARVAPTESIDTWWRWTILSTP